MGYFQVRYDSRVINYDRRGFIRLATGLQFLKFGINCFTHYMIITTFFSFLVNSSLAKLKPSCTVILPPTVSVLS